MLEERDAELAAVGRVLQAAIEGAGAGLLIEGPAGIGKTGLLLAARGLAGGRVQVLGARASELEHDFPFAIVRQLFEPVVRDELFTGAAALAAPVLTLEAGEDDAGAALHGLYWLTANLAAEQSLLILVDDLHWADPPSLRWLAYLAQRLDGLAAGLIATARPEREQPVLDVLAANPSIEVLHPRGLSHEAIGRMLGAAADEAYIAACARVTGGNPFLLGELLRELEGVAPTAANAPQVERQTSRTVSRAALARLRRLDAGAAALARAVVILGDGAEPALAAALAGLDADTAAAAADALEHAAILTNPAMPPPAEAPPAGGRRLAFVHPLVRESIYADLSAAERARAHRRAAALLAAAGAPDERVAIHAHEADPAGDPEVVRVLRSAAAGARRRGATEVAISHLRRALREPPEDERAVRCELGAAELQAGHYAVAADLLVGDPLLQGTALQLANRPEEAVAALNTALASLDDSRRELGLLLQATRGAASQGSRDAAELARGAGFRFAAPADTPSTTGERLFVAGLAYREAMRGRADRARKLALRTLDLLDDPSLPAVYATPLALFFSGALVEATEALNRVIEWARRHGSQLAFAQASHLRAAAWWRRGNLAEAEADASNAAEYTSFMVSPAVLTLLEIRLVQDDIDGAARLWRESGLDADPLEGHASVQTRHMRARIKLATGEDGLPDLLACGEMERQWGIRTPAHSTWRSDAVRLGATELSAEDVARARRFGDPRPLGIALRAAGEHEESVAVLRDSPARLELALSLLERGAALRRAGQRANARDPLRETVELAAQCGATAVAARAHDELVAAGARPRRDPIESRSRLTASELRVARMAADGMTNREIAQALFLTEKTIEVHLTSTYRKLDIASRSQLPRALPT